jgi:hypothetical protein
MTHAQGPVRAVTPPVLGAFFVFAAAMAGFAAETLLEPGGPLDPVWRIKPAEHAQLLAMGPLVGLGFSALSVVAVIGAVGAFQRRRWGWWVAVLGISANGLADAARGLAGARLEGLIGVTVAGAIVWWLTRPRVRALFDR